VTHRGIVLIGASAGGLEALQRILSAMPQDLGAAILIVLHTANHSGNLLPLIRLSWSARVIYLCPHPRDGDRIQRGRVYIAPRVSIWLSRRALCGCCRALARTCNGRRSDPLFRSAAAAYGRRVIGVILSGTEISSEARLGERRSSISGSSIHSGAP
jgi:two-component system, chemotaxis family, protein-glutamate methylesterase/glutaminase